MYIIQSKITLGIIQFSNGALCNHIDSNMPKLGKNRVFILPFDHLKMNEVRRKNKHCLKLSAAVHWMPELQGQVCVLSPTTILQPAVFVITDKVCK